MPWSVEDLEITPDDLVAVRLSDGWYEIDMLGYLCIQGRSARVWDLTRVETVPTLSVGARFEDWRMGDGES